MHDNNLLTTELNRVTRKRTRSKSQGIFSCVTQSKLRVTPWIKNLICRQKKIILSVTVFLIYLSTSTLSAQVRVRVFANQAYESALFTVTCGVYEINTYTGDTWRVRKGALVVISKFNDKLAVKIMNETGFVCDSVIFSGQTGTDYFSLRTNGESPLKQNYTGDLQSLPDLGTIVLINICNIESYIAGVVKSEGGSGKHPEFFRTQAVIARTYMYKYFDKHSADRYNLCDNTHCQAFNGLTTDSVIINAAYETKGEVIVDADSILIFSAFHSNCGGETSPSENVWLTSLPYLKKVRDPYCLSSRNAKWEKTISLNEWTGYLKRSGYNDDTGNVLLLNFSQTSRLNDYKTGSFIVPLRQIRTDLKMRSTFFSVTVDGDSVIIRGRGYGHGVGLCQEGAMVMAAKGFNYRQIISYYYTGVRITDISHSVHPDMQLGQALKGGY